MKKTILLFAAAALALGAGPALAKKNLVIVVKGLDNPFFEAIHQGCEKWNKENAASEYACVYTGPASTSDEAGEVQIVTDKLNDPAKAEPVVQRMIQLEPGEPANYFQLAKIYEDAGAYDEAEKMLVAAKTAKPSDPAVYMTLAGYYNRQGRFDKTIEALQERAQKEPNNPEAFYTISTYYWDEAYRDFKLKEAEKKDYIAKGLEAVDHALQLKPDYMEALVYKNLLLRSEALLEKDRAKQDALIKEADKLRDKAQELRKQKAVGVGN